MKMSSSQFNKLHDTAEQAYGIEVLLHIAEEYPSQLSDEEITAIFGTLKKLISPVTSYLQDEVNRQERG
ncbi:hypothetical protein VRB95_06270 [Erwinia aphidicola]